MKGSVETLGPKLEPGQKIGSVSRSECTSVQAQMTNLVELLDLKWRCPGSV
jgi:hypothetical protein